MKAEILSVGTELLLGDIVNTNATFIAKELALIGVDCYYQTVVGDNPERLKAALETAFSRSDIVIMTGGLGPTYDDLTKEITAKYFGLELELHQPSYDMLIERFKKFGHSMTNNNTKQAMMPKGAIVFPNDRGTANGLAVEAGGKTAIMMPGPPREMEPMFLRRVIPYLVISSDHVLVSANIHLFGIGESTLEEELHEYMLGQENPTVAPYAKEGEVLLRVTAGAYDEAGARALLKPVVEEISRRYPEFVYGVDVGSLQKALVTKLVAAAMTIATAESCTGGLVSQRITAISGSSEVFGLGVCTYSNQMKQEVLGVSSDTLEKYGAVSEQTALEMARGVRLKAGADFGVSTTGVAGPTGGTPEKPVGLVYVAVSHKDYEQVLELNLGRGYADGRQNIRYIAASHVLNLAIKTVGKLLES